MLRIPLTLAIVVAVGAVACVNIVPTPSFTPTVTSAPTRAPTPSASPSASPAPASPTPSGTPTGATPPSSPTAGETPSGTINPGLAAEIDEVIAQMPDLRELEALEEVPYEFITRDQFRQELLELAFEETPPEVLAAQERLLKRLGLMDDDADLEELIVELYGEGVAAFYRPDTGRFYIIERGESFGNIDRMIVAHEYTHALQDQHFDLEGTRITDQAEGDAALGQLAAIEGDATLAMQLWAQQNLSFQELIELFTQSLSQFDDQTLAEMPAILRRQLEFPYVEGFVFINELHSLGGFDAVDQTLREPPPSTEQILHPEKYLADEAPVTVDLDDLSAELGAGWQIANEQTLGELSLGVWVAGGQEPRVIIPGLPVEWPQAEVAAGWAGDRLQMYEGPDNGWAIVWETVWDSNADADEFEDRASELQSTLDGVSEISAISQRPDPTVTLFVASDQALLNDLVGLAPE